MEYYLAFIKKEILSFATTWLSLEDVVKWSKPGKDRKMPHVLTYMCNL
jgi:hypothetical protein